MGDNHLDKTEDYLRQLIESCAVTHADKMQVQLVHKLIEPLNDLYAPTQRSGLRWQLENSMVRVLIPFGSLDLPLFINDERKKIPRITL